MGMVQYHSAVNPPAVPDCSVCIANYNGAALLTECLESVLTQQGSHNIEVIVHDDASTDDSLALLKQRYPQVDIIASQQNVGFCIGNNRMVARARGKYVLLLNNDATLAPDAIQHLLGEATKIDGQAILTLPQLDWENDTLVDRGCLLDPFCNPIPNLDPRRDEVAYVIGACLWCSRDTWHELGGFPDWMGSIGEDLYLCGVARLHGIPVRALRSSYYRHRQGATFGGNRADAGLHTSIRRRKLSEHNKTRALMILTPTLLMWPLLFAHLIALLIEGLILSLLRRNTTLLHEVYLPAFASPFREGGFLRARRREIQATRTISIAKWFSTVSWQLRKLTMLVRHGMPKIS
ncbi:glycosyltransferase family 2 protein [Rhodanobacter hydrolyticus]|uniref:Glycosyltransferase family 2 protein n=1 Tax=Rhodanobacter hydrolyticus TaxID=2250595 RepID=A0ABW8J9M7_9GAMM